MHKICSANQTLATVRAASLMKDFEKQISGFGSLSLDTNPIYPLKRFHPFSGKWLACACAENSKKHDSPKSWLRLSPSAPCTRDVLRRRRSPGSCPANSRLQIPIKQSLATDIMHSCASECFFQPDLAVAPPRWVRGDQDCTVVAFCLDCIFMHFFLGNPWARMKRWWKMQKRCKTTRTRANGPKKAKKYNCKNMMRQDSCGIPLHLQKVHMFCCCFDPVFFYPSTVLFQVLPL